MAEKLDGKDQDLASSDQAEQDVADMPVDTGDTAKADPSPATDGVKAEDTLSIVRDAVAKTDATAETQGSSPEGEEVGEGEADEEPPKPDDTDYTDVPFSKHPRFKQLLRQKKEFEGDANRYRNIERFMAESSLGAEEVADGMQIMALAKANPALAWERLRPWAERVAIAAGAILPQDLGERVAKGELSQSAALELSQARARAQSFEGQRQFDAQRQQERDQQMHASSLRDTATNWETTRRARDPNFEAKLPALQREIAFLQATEGRPASPEGVQAQCEKAYQAVNSGFRPARPQPTAQQKPAKSPITGGQVAGNVREEPKDTLGIIRAARASRA